MNYCQLDCKNKMIEYNYTSVLGFILILLTFDSIFSVRRSPFDWFEITYSISLDISFYIKVGLFIEIGFVKVEIVLYEYKKDWKFYLLGPVTLKPDPIEKVAEIGSDGTVMLNEPDLICETKGGSAGSEGK